MGQRLAWNKGTKGVMKPNKTSFTVGHKRTPTKPKVEKECLECGDTFFVHQSLVIVKCCSQVCGAKYRYRVSSHPMKGRKQTDEAKRKISSAHKLLVGELSPSWQGGKTSEERRERIRFRNHLQKKVFIRDNFTCVICNAYGGSIQVDHIKRWSEYPELRFEIDNCRTLCMACHYYVTFKKKLPKGMVWGHNLKRRMTS